MLIDSSAWLEYFMGTKKGATLRDVIEGEAQLFTSPVVLAEIYSKSMRTDGIQKAKERADFITRRCILINIDEGIGINAGKLHAEHKSKIKDFGMIDALILASAMHKNVEVITYDQSLTEVMKSMGIESARL